MNKEEMHEKAFLYACGSLEEAEAERFESLMRTDRELRDEAYEWQKVNETAVLELADEKTEVPFQSYAGIMSRIGEEDKGASSANSSNRSNVVSFLHWGGWAVAACAVLVFALSWDGPGSGSSSQPQFVVDAASSDIVLNDLGNPRGAATVAVANNDSGIEDRMLEVAEIAEAYWFSREGLGSQESDPSQEWTDGFTIFDRKYKIGFIGVENMPESRVGKYYNVWARSGSDGQPVWAGSLPMGDASRGLFYFDLSNNTEIDPLDNAVSFFVTEDLTDRPEAPQGPVVLGDI